MGSTDPVVEVAILFSHLIAEELQEMVAKVTAAD